MGQGRSVAAGMAIELDGARDAEVMAASDPGKAGEEVGLSCSMCGTDLTSANSTVCIPALSDLNAPYVLCHHCLAKQKKKGKQEDAGASRAVLFGARECVRKAYPSLSLSVRNRFIVYAHRQCIGRWRPQLKCFEYLTYGEVYHQARCLATTLQIFLGEGRSGEGIQTKEVVCLRCENVDFIPADLATIFADFVSGPIAVSVGPSAMLAMLKLCKCRALFVSPDELEASVSKIVHEADLMVVICMGAITKRPEGWPEETTLLSLDEAMDMGKTWVPIKFSRNPETDVRTLVFTSGSTGVPKAVMKLDARVTASVDTPCIGACCFCFSPLPLAAARINIYNVYMSGGRVDYFDGNFTTFWEQVRISEPSWFNATPRVWDWLFSNFKARVDELVRGTPMEWSAAVEQAAQEYRRDVFGPRCRMVQSGSAKTSEEVFYWMQCTFSETMSVYEGYGTTEAGHLATNFKLGAKVVPHLEDCLDYHTTDEPVPRGLLWVHTPAISAGYLGDASKTAEDFRDLFGDGRIFFNTGDIVTLDSATREIHVIDRYKNFLKLTQGVFVSPESIECKLIVSKFVKQVFVHASSDWDCVLCVVVPSESVLRSALAGPSDSVSFPDVCKLDEARNLVLASLQEAGSTELQPHEIPRAVLLDPNQWTPQNGLMTPSFKLSRNGLIAKFGSKLARLHKTCVLGQDPLTLSQSVDLTTSAILEIVGRGGAVASSSTKAHSQVVSFDDLIRRHLGRRLADCKGLRITECGLDSIGIVQVHQAIQKLGVIVPFELLAGQTLGQLADYITNAQIRNFDEGVVQGESDVNWSEECTLPDDIRGSGESPVQSTAPSGDVFLTGASGFLGIFILSELLKKSTFMGKVVVLVRSEDRLRASAAKYSRTIDWARVVVIIGDLSEPNLGLQSMEALRNVAQFIHNGCLVNGVYPYSLLKGPNVVSTLSILRLASRIGAHVTYVSSTSALTSTSEGHGECSLSVTNFSRLSGYGQSKRVSELLLGQAAARGMSISIVRPGTIAPINAWNPGDTITRMFEAVAALRMVPIPPAGKEWITGAPVDYVSRVVVHARPAVTLNVAGVAVLWNDLFDETIPRVPLREFVSRIDTGSSLSPLLSYFEYGRFPLGNNRDLISVAQTDAIVGECPSWRPPPLNGVV